MEIVRKSRELEQGDLVHKKEDDTRIYMIIYDDNTDYCWCLLNLENAEITDGYEVTSTGLVQLQSSEPISETNRPLLTILS